MTSYSDDFLDEARYITMRKSLKYKNGIYDHIIDELCTQLGESQLTITWLNRFMKWFTTRLWIQTK